MELPLKTIHISYLALNAAVYNLRSIIFPVLLPSENNLTRYTHFKRLVLTFNFKGTYVSLDLLGASSQTLLAVPSQKETKVASRPVAGGGGWRRAPSCSACTPS